MGEEWQTSHTLLKRAKNQDDQAAWEEFVSYYQDFIVMVLRKMNLYSADIDDLSQEILIKIWKNLPKHIYDKNRATFRTWLSQVIRNQVINHMRTTQRRDSKHAQVAKDETVGRYSTETEPEIERIVQREWEVYIVKLALKNISSLFSEGAITAFTMSVDGKSTQQIAQHLGVKPNSVIKLKNRVKVRLAEEIQHLRDELESV
jgi:RNA polymerase sigma-70 factor (ECF subfamily)